MWVDKVRTALGETADSVVRQVLNALVVKPLPAARSDDVALASGYVFRLQEVTALRRINDLKSRLQRTNPVEQATEYNRMFGELIELERHKKGLRAKAVGEL